MLKSKKPTQNLYSTNNDNLLYLDLLKKTKGSWGKITSEEKKRVKKREAIEKKLALARIISW
jgi:hypothetical protein